MRILLLLVLFCGAAFTQNLNHQHVTNIDISSDGKLLVSSGEDWKVNVWDIASGKRIANYPHQSYTYSAVFSPDMKYIAYGTFNNRFFVRNVQTGKIVLQKYHHEAHCVRFSPDGKYFITAGMNSCVTFYNISDGKQAKKFTVDKKQLIHSIEFSADEKYIAVTSYGTQTWAGIVTVWDIAAEKEIWRSTRTSMAMGNAIFHPQKNILAVLQSNLFLIDIEQQQIISEIKGNYYSACFSKDGKQLITIDGDGVTFWDWHNKTSFGPLNLGGRSTSQVKIHQNGLMAVSAENSITIGNYSDFLKKAQVLEKAKPSWEKVYLCTKDGKETSRFSIGDTIYAFVSWKIAAIPEDFKTEIVFSINEYTDRQEMNKKCPSKSGISSEIIPLEFIKTPKKSYYEEVNVRLYVENIGIYKSLSYSVE